MAYGVAVVLVAGSGLEVDLIATHFSFFPSSTTATLGVSDFSVSSSEVTLSSVSASTPVVVSDSEELADDDDEAASVVVLSATTTTAGVGSVGGAVEGAAEESLFAANFSASFFALTRSLLSNFYIRNFVYISEQRKS